ncbi:hypothetical protein chiPu_0032851, partial [Chiloscyllium punctatum]|nr:hypothetical protein [Chiloscyllium punctatum]
MLFPGRAPRVGAGAGAGEPHAPRILILILRLQLKPRAPTDSSITTATGRKHVNTGNT